MKKINIAAYHPILNIEQHIVFANNGNVVLCYKGNLPEIYSLSEEIVNSVVAKFGITLEREVNVI